MNKDTIVLNISNIQYNIEELVNHPRHDTFRTHMVYLNRLVFNNLPNSEF